MEKIPTENLSFPPCERGKKERVLRPTNETGEILRVQPTETLEFQGPQDFTSCASRSKGSRTPEGQGAEAPLEEKTLVFSSIQKRKRKKILFLSIDLRNFSQILYCEAILLLRACETCEAIVERAFAREEYE